MKAERLVFKNTFTLSIGKAIGDIASFLFLAYFSRSFGQDALGQYAFAMATGGLLSIFVSLGLSTYAIREISKDPGRGPEFMGQLFVLRAACALFCWGLLWFVALAAGSPAETRHILLIMAAHHFLQCLIGIFSAGFMAHEEMVYPAVFGLLERILILMAGSGAILFSLTPVATLMAFPASSSIILAASYTAFRIRHGRPIFRFHLRFFKSALREASPFLVIMILAQFYDRIGLIILTVMKGEAVAGIFMAGDRLLATINGFSAIFATALFPSVSKLSEGKMEDLEQLCAWALRMAFVFIFPLACLIYILSDQFTLLAFGEKFRDSAPVLRIACWSLVLFGFNRILSIVLIAFYKQGQLVRIRMAAYIGYVIISTLLIWKFSYLGLAWSKIITEGGLFMVTVALALRLTPAIATLGHFVVPAALCLLFLLGIAFTGAGPILTLLLFIAIYIMIAAYFKLIRVADLRGLKALLPTRGAPPSA